MIPVRIGTALAIATTVVGLSAAARLVLRSPLDRAELTTLTVGPAEPGVLRPLSPDSLAEAAARRDPFRLTRVPAPEHYGATPAPELNAAPRPPRPSLVLVGIVGGPEPVALVDGLPGVESTRALFEGERVGDLVVRRIAEGRVIIAAPDTAWILEVRSRFP